MVGEAGNRREVLRKYNIFKKCQNYMIFRLTNMRMFLGNLLKINQYEVLSTSKDNEG